MEKTTSDLLIVPKLDKRADLAIDISVAEDIYEFATVAATRPFAVAISNLRLLQSVVDYADLYGLNLIVFTGVPGADYDPHFDQVTWSLPRVGYDTVVIEAASLDRMQKLKDEERPRVAGGGFAPTTEEEVKKQKAPSSFGSFIPTNEGDDDAGDE